jgi:hypothetical protein
MGATPLPPNAAAPWQLLKVNNARLRFLTAEEAEAGKLLAELKDYNPQLHDMALLSLNLPFSSAVCATTLGHKLQHVDAAIL